MTYPYPGIDTFDQTLQDAWWTPGWTSQNQAWVLAPPSGLSPTSPQVTYVNVTGRYLDLDDNPLGGFLTFMPSDNATLTISGTSWRLPKRPTGIPLPVIIGPGGPGWATNQFGSGKVYIQGGLLAVALFPTDTPGLVTDGGQPLTYTVVEHMLNGRQFSINVPSASSNPVDINSLITAGSTQPYAFDPMFPLGTENEPPVIGPLPTQVIPYGATEYVSVNVTLTVPGIGNQNPTTDPVYLAFMKTTATPQNSDWVTATWTTTTSPYLASVLVGPANGGLNLPQGTYYVWLKIVDNPEVTFIQAGILNIV